MVTYKIWTLNKISDAGVKTLYGSGLEIDNNEPDPAGIVVRSASMHDLTFGSNLRAVARAGAGVNNIPVDRCTANGIVVFNTPGANANAVKELAVLRADAGVQRYRRRHSVGGRPEGRGRNRCKAG
jgi:D-3-phosphoglycerate dehydrogenase